MGYKHIDNLYKNQAILMFRECYALEKIHGTSAHITYNTALGLSFFSGGEKHERFCALFDAKALDAAFLALGHPDVTVYGEAYGGSQQGQAYRYGKELRFVAFEVRIGDKWLAVPQAAEVVASLGLEFVSFCKVSTDIAAIDFERDRPSAQALRNGMGVHPQEGVVLRPLVEVTLNNGERIMAKHKRDEERETKTPRKVIDPEKQAVLTEAQAIADEWVTPTRLEHVLQTFGAEPVGIEKTGAVISAMIEDITREAKGEIVDSREARAAIGKACALLFKARLQQALRADP